MQPRSVIQQTTDEKPVAVDPRLVTADEQQVRELAVEQIGRKRRFRRRAFSAAVVGVVLVVIWAIVEYHNAGGWPTSGFSQSSGIHDEWNSWIIYPLVALALGIAIDAWHTYRHRPISESEIRPEMDRGRDRGAVGERQVDDPTKRLDWGDVSMSKSENFTSRAARWSAAHRRAVVLGWLAFVVVAFALGSAAGMVSSSRWRRRTASRGSRTRSQAHAVPA